uniref:Serine/threonine-protein phosphatase 7 long form homolog n=1 Tax=Nicotiana sylvestris TaxID=4096 RepID=A0A1U7YBW7_NICSY|nr:PREDICTED: serine/threonine-protein phosphatase 7 long form homolog [Nicotiana sylvestris]
MDLPHVHPGPAADQILVLKSDHRSAYVWERHILDQTLCARRPDDLWDFLMERAFHACVVHRLRATDFLWIFEIGRMQLDWSLIMALIEWWRPEVPQGEVAVRVGSHISVTAIRQHMEVLHPDITDETEDLHIGRYTRLALFLVFGSVLFPNTSGNLVSLRFLHHLQLLDELPQYSWGAAILAYLYMSMCWASMGTQPPLPPLEPGVAPPFLPLATRWVLRHGNYRDSDAHHNLLLVRGVLDMLVAGQFIWTPYNNELLADLPDYCSVGRLLWSTSVPIMCLDVVEHHAIERAIGHHMFYHLGQEIQQHGDNAAVVEHGRRVEGMALRTLQRAREGARLDYAAEYAVAEEHHWGRPVPRGRGWARGRAIPRGRGAPRGCGRRRGASSQPITEVTVADGPTTPSTDPASCTVDADAHPHIKRRLDDDDHDIVPGR